MLVRWHRGPLRELLRGGLQKWQPSFATRLLFDCGFDELGEQRERWLPAEVATFERITTGLLLALA